MGRRALGLAQTNGATPLHIASEEGHDAAVRALVSAGAAVNQTMVASVSGLLVSRRLLTQGIASHALMCGWQADGSTPLYLASEKGHDAVVKTLLASGASTLSVRVSRQAGSVLPWTCHTAEAVVMTSL